MFDVRRLLPAPRFCPVVPLSPILLSPFYFLLRISPYAVQKHHSAPGEKITRDQTTQSAGPSGHSVHSWRRNRARTSGRRASAFSMPRWKRPTAEKENCPGSKCSRARRRKTNSTSWLPDDTVEAFREYLVGIKGPLTTPVGGGIPFAQCGVAANARSVRLSAAGPVFRASPPR